jgi:hypothetical protein
MLIHRGAFRRLSLRNTSRGGSRAWLGALGFGGVVSFCFPAAAQDARPVTIVPQFSSTPVASAGASDPIERVEMRERWYGWQVLPIDAAAAALIASGASRGLEGRGLQATVLGFGLFELGSPIVHIAHDNWTAAGGSLMLRLTLPVLGAALASDAACGPSDVFCGARAGAWLGAGAAIAIDAAILGREQARVDVGLNRSSASFRVAPIVMGDAHGATLGAAGIF